MYVFNRIFSPALDVSCDITGTWGCRVHLGAVNRVLAVLAQGVVNPTIVSRENGHDFSIRTSNFLPVALTYDLLQVV